MIGDPPPFAPSLSYYSVTAHPLFPRPTSPQNDRDTLKEPSDFWFFPVDDGSIQCNVLNDVTWYMYWMYQRYITLNHSFTIPNSNVIRSKVAIRVTYTFVIVAVICPFLRTSRIIVFPTQPRINTMGPRVIQSIFDTLSTMSASSCVPILLNMIPLLECFLPEAWSPVMFANSFTAVPSPEPSTV